MSKIIEYNDKEIDNIIRGYILISNNKSKYPPDIIILLIHLFVKYYTINCQEIKFRKKPSPRSLFGMTIINNIIYIFGGSNKHDRYMNDLWALNGMQFVL